jgi:hypothetical protein
MPHDEAIVTIKGTILDVFAHRFVVETAKGKILADFGKHNLEKITIKSGDEVELTGEQKPSELKIYKMTLNGKPVVLEPKEKDHHKHEEMKSVDPGIAIHAAKKEHVNVIGKPHRKPQHFEVLGKNPQGELVELHIEFDGKLRKSKPVNPDDEKWAQELSAA